MALVGNKADLDEKREVTTQVSIVNVLPAPLDMKFTSGILILLWYLLLKDGIDCAEKNGMFFIETSAKTADNINQLFEVCSSMSFLKSATSSF